MSDDEFDEPTMIFSNNAALPSLPGSDPFQEATQMYAPGMRRQNQALMQMLPDDPDDEATQMFAGAAALAKASTEPAALLPRLPDDLDEPTAVVAPSHVRKRKVVAAAEPRVAETSPASTFELPSIPAPSIPAPSKSIAHSFATDEMGAGDRPLDNVVSLYDSAIRGERAIPTQQMRALDIVEDKRETSNVLLAVAILAFGVGVAVTILVAFG